jgi:hypothetical protein
VLDEREKTKKGCDDEEETKRMIRKTMKTCCLWSNSQKRFDSYKSDDKVRARVCLESRQTSRIPFTSADGEIK